MNSRFWKTRIYSSDNTTCVQTRALCSTVRNGILGVSHSFWKLVLKLYCSENIYTIDKDDYCFEFHDDNLSDIVPHYHGNRLMKDEYIDGSSFCVASK